MWIGRLEPRSTRILRIGDLITLKWIRLPAERPRAMAEGPIAATASVHGKFIVTRNVGDFADNRIPVIKHRDKKLK